MSAADDPSPSWAWTPRNLLGLLAVGLCLLGLAAWRAWRNPARVADDLTVQPAALAPAADSIDPNTASWASLARLPGIGKKLANDICAYREQFVHANPARPAFLSVADLGKVSGIGPVTLDRIARHLTFPSPARPATAPAATGPADRP